jgi:hypothetical protein
VHADCLPHQVRPEGCLTDECMLIASLIKCAPKVV